MVKLSATCPVPTNVDKIWTYDQYYTGENDAEERKNGQGENHWTGAEVSISVSYRVIFNFRPYKRLI